MHKPRLRFATALAVALLAAAPSFANTSLWTELTGPAAELTGERLIQPSRARILRLDPQALASLLAAAPHENVQPSGLTGVELTIPVPGGKELLLRVIDSPIMEPGLAAKYPEIRTFRLVDPRDARISGRGDWTPHGFHALVRTAEGTVYVDPYRRGDNLHYQVYYRADLAPLPGRNFECHVEGESTPFGGSDAIGSDAIEGGTPVNLRTYRLAVAATGEYTAFHGGTVPDALASIVIAVNRVNQVYERDVAIRMVLVANNDLVIYTNGATDPYTNSSGSAMLTQNTTTLNTVITSANYDIGHVFSTGGGGVATLNGPCGSSKARGVTGLPSPIGDPFYIDFVAHEMGHQWGGNHSFNGSSGNCSGGNRNGSTAYEPGSGSTIMAYAGICSPQDLQSFSDDYFHRISLDEIIAFSRSGNGNTCAVIGSENNSPPEVEAGPSYTIPLSTPFALTGSATDDAFVEGGLTYTWEQWNLGAAGHPNSPVGNAPIFRSFAPVSTPTRTFPRVSDLVNNTQTLGEILPSYARTLTFRLTARDNAGPAGAVGFDETNVVVAAGTGPFLVTAPNTAVTLTGAGPHTITWNVAGTTAPPINCAAVDILLSVDGGLTFDTVVDESLPNTGSQLVYIGAPDTADARIKVACSDNIFFDISNVDFTLADADALFANNFEQGNSSRWDFVSP